MNFIDKNLKFAIRAFCALALLLVISGSAHSQCAIENNFFKTGEVLKYDLHFKWGIISKKAGSATLKTTDTTFAGKDAYKITMISQSEGAARNFFKMNDTISSVLSKDLIPLAFYKDAHEDDKYTKEELFYKYLPNKQIKIRSIRYKEGIFKFDETFNTQKCTYDVMSIVFYARTLNYASMKRGDKTTVDFITGKKKLKMTINHSGIENLKMGDGKKYKCIKLTLKISDDAFANEEDAMTVYITNDNNRMPIRIDSKLKIGNARVILNSYSGNKYPVSIVD